MAWLTEKEIGKLRRLQSVKINGVELNDQERIFLCWLLQREYADLTVKIQQTLSNISFSRKQARDEMVICLRLLTLVERSNKKWIFELNLSREQANQEKNTNA